MVEFFRHCPECGRRFHIILESTKMISDEKRMIPTKRAVRVIRPGWQTYKGGNAYTPPGVTTELIEGPPIIMKEEEFEYTYKCGHCGHEWTEHRMEEHREH
jgi:predicted RNA-binding Zn-ribbon protein involved in translation (DUF1610 family)